MKFSCNQQTLAKALNTVSKAVSTRTTLPILKGILLEVNDDELIMTATDLDLSIEKKIQVSVQENGSAVVSARLFSDIIRKLPNGAVEIETSPDNTVTVRCLSSEFHIVGQPANDFPNRSDFNETQAIKINGSLLCAMIRKTFFAASVEESKGILVGILMELNEKSLTLAALDGFRMAVANAEIPTSAENTKIVIAARILNEVSKIIGESGEEEDTDVTLILGQKKAMLGVDDTRVTLSLLEGEFIKYRDIIPKSQTCRLLLNRTDFMNSMERASLFAKDGKNNLIKMSVLVDKIVITSRSEEGNVKEEVFTERQGDGLDIGFNSKYLLDVLKAVPDEFIVMEMTSSVSPCLIKPLEGDGFIYMVLPVRIASN